MGSIPLPALDIRPPQQQSDPLEQVSRLMQLRSQMQNAPLQTQQLQQNVQSGQLGIQQQQQQLKDQRAVTAAMQNWDGEDYNDILPLVKKNGGSGQAVIGLKSKILEQQQAISTAYKNNAEGAQAQVAAVKTKGDLLDGALSSLIDPAQTPDAQLPQALVSTAQSLAQKGVLDPQHAQQAAQFAQAPPDQIRQQLDLMRKTNLAQSQILEDASKKAATGEALANTSAKQAEVKFYQQNGGAPGVPVDAQQQADWLNKPENKGKGPSDYKLWVMQHSPSAIVMQNQLGGPQNQPALDMAANNYRLTGQMPPFVYRSPGSGAAILSRAAEMDKQEGGSGIAANKALLGSYTQSLDGLQKNFSQVQAFENTATKNMDLLQQTAQKIPDLGARFANVPVRMISSQMIGTENMASFKTALATAQTEAAKVLNSSNATGVLSDSSRHELQDIIDGNVPLPALVASLNTLKQDMANRTSAYQDQINDLQRRIKGAGTGAPQNPTPPQPAPNADPFAQFGGKQHP